MFLKCPLAFSSNAALSHTHHPNIPTGCSFGFQIIYRCSESLRLGVVSSFAPTIPKEKPLKSYVWGAKLVNARKFLGRAPRSIFSQTRQTPSPGWAMRPICLLRNLTLPGFVALKSRS